ncbi:MAG: ATP-binding cassette domain-containing protein [Pseudomonadota bacterium]
MARPPLLQLSGIRLGFGGSPVFENLDLVIQPGDRVALVGRNGSGKSTLMKVMAGLVEPDDGHRTTAPSTSVGYMQQEPDLSGFATLGEFAASDLPVAEAWRIEMAAEGLKLPTNTPTDKASGGERRRAALVKLLAEAPDLMLLDEPTNHLDIEAIAWLETHLTETQAAYILISHDRTFLRRLTRATLWIDRGEVRRQNRGFQDFEAWRDKVWEEEDIKRHKLDRKIKAEARWAVEGISARRKRNMGRVRALGELRKTRAEMIRRPDTAAMSLDAGQKSGKRVIEAKGISKAFTGKTILKPFDIRILRGDRVAFVGPNGVGKTTVLKMLTGELPPDSGSIAHGTNLELAVFDQNRAQLDPDLSLWESLTGDPSMRVSGRADQVMVRGAPRHVVGYLKDYLFDENQARSPVRSLSGGERARLMLARIMARQSNLLVLDEPTNDLDIETLDLLQEVLADYPGTVLLVSHDRDFIDRVATSTVGLEGDGRAVIYAGGWSDYQAQRPQIEAPVKEPKSNTKASSKPSKSPNLANARGGLSFTEAHRLKTLPEQIERLEAEIAKLEQFLSDPELFAKDPLKFQKASAALVERQSALGAAEEDWLMLEEKAASAS